MDLLLNWLTESIDLLSRRDLALGILVESGFAQEDDAEGDSFSGPWVGMLSGPGFRGIIDDLEKQLRPVPRRAGHFSMSRGYMLIADGTSTRSSGSSE
jgi:hypothetical protein